MKKIAIITEADENTTNYGNVLQAYALNHYLNRLNNCDATTLLVNSIVYKKITSINPLIWLKKILKRILHAKKNNNINSQRQLNFKQFLKKIKTKKIVSIQELKNTKYDLYVVGSDIVWIQNRGVINRIKFLDFNDRKRISYAASFGVDYIPKENISYMRKCLNNFSAISVREKSSVQLLKSININNAMHVCDPTLLLPKKEWVKIEKKIVIDDKYIFVYLLGKNSNQRKKIKEFAKNENLKIVTIPNSNGIVNDVDDNFGDYRCDDCCPEEWLYLIDNCEYIFTDSFHGLIFSTIFEKKFFVVKRDNELNINNRTIDFLKNIKEEDKYIDLQSQINIKKYVWNYERIESICTNLKCNSEEFLNNNI